MYKNINLKSLGMVILLFAANTICMAGQIINDLTDFDKVDIKPPEPILVAENVDYQDFLAASGLEPTTYVVKQYKNYPVILLGEYHWKKQQVEFVKSLIRPLVEQAGVTTFVFEFGDRRMQAELNKFMRLPVLNDGAGDTILKILGSCARNNPKDNNFQAKEYVEVYEELWRINRDYPGKVKVQIACSEPDELDQFSIIIPLMAHYGYPVSTMDDFTIYINQHPQEWERFKNEHGKELEDMLKQQATEFDIQKDKNFVSLTSAALENKEKVFVWAGSNHLVAHTNDFRRSVGYALNQKFPGKIFSIIMHYDGRLGSSTPFGPFMENEILKYSGRPIAFPLYYGPFGEITINEEHLLKDAFDGYIFLCPFTGYIHTRPLLSSVSPP